MDMEIYKAFLDGMTSMAVITDKTTSIIYANKAFYDETGYDEAIIGEKSSLLKSGHHSLLYYSNLYHTIKAGMRWEGRFRNKRKDGSLFYEEAAIFPVTLGDTVYYCKTAVNTTKKEELVSENKQSIQLASAIQQSLISEDIYDEALVIKGLFLPLENVSGDIYNLYELPDGRYVVFIADVVGHGVASALLTTSILALANELVKQDPSPDVFLDRMNRRIMKLFNSNDLSQTTYFTAAYLVIDPKNKRVDYANCGHPQMYKLKGSEVIPFSKVNFFIGMFQDVAYEYDTMTYDSGDRLLVYSDGLIEKMGDLKKGEAELMDALTSFEEGCPGQDLLECLNDVLIEGRKDISDDVTVVTVELK